LKTDIRNTKILRGVRLANNIRFFVDKREFVDTEYWDIPIPQLKSVVFLHNKPLAVKNIIYSYIRGKENYNMIDVFVEHMEDEDYADFN